MNLYTEEVSKILHRPMPHAGLIIDVVEHEDHLMLILYKDNLNSFPAHKQQDLALWVQDTLTRIKALGIPVGWETVGITPRSIS